MEKRSFRSVPARLALLALAMLGAAKLRPRFDLSASERALPQATTRRAKRAALSNPSPTTIASLNNQNLLLRANFARWHHVYRAYNILPCRSDKRSASDNSPRTVPIKKPRRSRVYVN